MNAEKQLTLIEPTPQPNVAITPMQMLQIAVEKGADVAQLERLLALQERWEATEARKAFVVAMAAFKASPPTVQKNKHVKFTTQKGVTEYDHATLDNVVDMITPALSKNGLSHRWETDQPDGGMIKVTCILTHILGHSERTTLQSGRDESGGKNSIQGVGSTVSYLQRYTLLAACGLATSEMDDDGVRASADFVTEDQAGTLQALAEEVGANIPAFLKYMKVESFTTIPAKRYKEMVSALERKRQ